MFEIFCDFLIQHQYIKTINITHKTIKLPKAISNIQIN